MRAFDNFSWINICISFQFATDYCKCVFLLVQLMHHPFFFPKTIQLDNT